MASTRTVLTYQHDASLHTLETIITAVSPFNAEETHQLFKDATEKHHVIITEKTIFHPQGGGQPSDTGLLKGPSSSFAVTAVRMDPNGRVLHLGVFEDSASIFKEGDTVQQTIDAEKRLLYSRLHTAGHVLGSAVRHLLEKEIEDFDELKASHFPDSAACEFRGSIEGKWKDSIQHKLDGYIAAKMPVQIEWWDEEDFRSRGLERLIPDRSLVPAGEKSRVVNIVGAEVYPCGGTHVDTTDICGPVTVKKISRKQGNSRVSYVVK
ncbi:hypothetical protein N7457_005266 [Penicillium paradoxum]|uniref:uncharacterized protein n=1 Tax=Penicillium paradoxum TaxID=176176 RepID=UPI002546B014|nr:uncharacterized protein N7457_005266 [Penicillium paradoxum]KAJ5780106.1 hypothetical protein N7457_005266 [Penicillium paradoxum]